MGQSQYNYKIAETILTVTAGGKAPLQIGLTIR